MLRKAPLALLAAAAGITMLAVACPPVQRQPAATGAPPAPAPAPVPPPAPRETEMRWTIGAADFGDDNAAIWAETSNRSEPYEWDRISAGNVRISIDGKELAATGENPPAFTSTLHEPAFDSDLTGAEWTVTAEVQTGAVVLVLTAPDQTYYAGQVVRVRMTSGGSGYASPPTVTFGGGEDSDAEGVAVGPGIVTGVMITSPGNGYLSAPTITFNSGGGADAAATAVVGGSDGAVVDVIVTDGGSGYTTDPTVAFTAPGTGTVAAGTAVVERSVTSVRITNGGAGYRTAPPVTFGSGGGGSGAAGIAVLQRRGNDEFQNLYFARQTLYGKELLVQVVSE